MTPSNPPSQPSLQAFYPWTTNPLLSSAPMRLISTAPLATSVTLSSGLGFIGAGSDISTLSDDLTLARSLLFPQETETSSQTPEQKSLQTSEPIPNTITALQDYYTQTSNLPIGVGFLTWGAPLATTLPILLHHRPCAIWLFAPRDPSHASLRDWTTALRPKTPTISASTSAPTTTNPPPYNPQIWIQIGSTTEALSATRHCAPDVLVLQGTDAGGHGLQHSASIISLVPETIDALAAAYAAGEILFIPAVVAAGGIADGRGVAAAVVLGAEGVCMGTRYLAAQEAVLTQGYRKEVLRASDGGRTTVRSKVYDTLRGTTDWPERYGGRGVTNASYVDAMGGMDQEENKRMYQEAIKMGDEGWGELGRMTTYAGTAVGLVRKVQSAREIMEEVHEQYLEIANKFANKL